MKGSKNLTGSNTNLSDSRTGRQVLHNLTGSNTNLSGSVGKLAGILDFVPNYNGDPGAAFIELLMLAGPYRGRGLGKAAVEWLLSAFSGETGQKRLYAAVQTNNPGAICFWQRLGFRITGPAALQADGTETYPIEMINDRET